MSKQPEFSREAFAATLKQITTAGQRYTTGIGKALLSVLYFNIVEGDVGPANELITALRKSTKRTGIVALLEEHGNMAFTATNPSGKDYKEPKFQLFDAMQTWMPEDVKELRAVCDNWEAYKPAPKDKGLDLLESLNKLIKSAEKRVENKQGVENVAMLALIKGIVAQHSSASALATATMS